MSRKDYYDDLILGAESGERSLEDIFIEAFGDVDTRLTTVEAAAGGMDEVREELVANGQALLNQVVTPLANQIRSAAELGLIFTAPSISTVTVGLGLRTFVITEAQLPTFAPPAMLTIAATDSPTIAMYARKIAYDRGTGTLIVDVLGVQGAGTYSSWTITAGAMVANANVMAIAPIDGLSAITVQAALAALALMVSGAATTAQLAALKNEILGGVGPAFDTLLELAAALGNNASLASEVTNALSQRLRLDLNQNLTGSQKAFGVANLGLDEVYPRLDGANAGPLVGFRNKFINPGFGIKQRRPDGSAINVGTGGYILCDRWRMRPQSETGGNVQVSVLPSTSDLYSPFGSEYLRIQRTVALTAPFQVSQRIEDVRHYGGRKLTVSIAAQDDAGGSVTFTARQVFGSGGSANVSINGTTAALVSGGTDLGVVSYTFDLPSIAGKTIGDGSYLEVFASFNSLGVGNTRVAFMQSEFGRFYTGAEVRPRAIEESLCRRYFERLVGYTNLAGFAVAATSAYFALAFSLKRAIPAISTPVLNARARDRTSSAASPTVTALAYSSLSALGALVAATVASGLTAGAGAILQSIDDGPTGLTIDIEAEL